MVVLRKGPHMSRMADLHIDIVTELSKTSKEFDKAIECGCDDCELYTIGEIEASK